MKSIKETEMLVNLAKALGQEVDESTLKQAKKISSLKREVLESVRSNIFTDLAKASKDKPSTELVVSAAPAYPIVTEFKELPKLVIPDPIDFPLPPSIDDIAHLLDESEPVIEPVAEEQKEEEVIQEPQPESMALATAKFIGESKDSFQQPEVEEIDPNDVAKLAKKVKFLEQWLSKVSMAGPGGGETKLRFLDDVDRDTIGNNKYLRYNSTKNKFDFSRIQGVITSDTPPDDPIDGDLWYNTLEGNLYVWLVENDIGQWVDTADGSGRRTITTTEVTSNAYTVVSTDEYIGVNSTTVVTITLPVTDSIGRVIMIKDESGNCALNPITVSGTVDNDAGGFILAQNNGGVQLVYRNGWRII